MRLAKDSYVFKLERDVNAEVGGSGLIHREIENIVAYNYVT